MGEWFEFKRQKYVYIKLIHTQKKVAYKSDRVSCQLLCIPPQFRSTLCKRKQTDD